MSQPHPLRAALDQALVHADASEWPVLDATRRDALLGYLDLLVRWNRAYNLTAVRDPAGMLSRHLLDSLALAPLVAGRQLLDAGTGAGLPGLVLAIALPELRCTLLDASLKKTRFCTQAVLELGLGNVAVQRGRLEDMGAAASFDTVTSRAVGELAWLWRHAGPLLAPGGRLLAMKGREPAGELEEVAAMGENPRTVSLRVPGLDEQRHVIIIQREAAEPVPR